MSIPITFLCGVYNEEKRIRFVLDHATKWADEVLIVDKSSTDKTVEICKEYPSVKVISIPYTMRGHDDTIKMVTFPANDWIFCGTASEVPTKKCIEKCKEILKETKGKLDLIRVPRKYYSLGIYHNFSPWGINYFPFFINRKKAVVTNKIHANFFSHGPNCERSVPFAEDCCVHHFTHTTAKGYIEDILQYMIREADDCETKQELQHKQTQSILNVKNYLEQKWKSGDKEIFGHMCAWAMYNYGTALLCWEKEHGKDISKVYRESAQEIINTEWK